MVCRLNLDDGCALACASSSAVGSGFALASKMTAVPTSGGRYGTASIRAKFDSSSISGITASAGTAASVSAACSGSDVAPSIETGSADVASRKAVSTKAASAASGAGCAGPACVASVSGGGAASIAAASASIIAATSVSAARSGSDGAPSVETGSADAASGRAVSAKAASAASGAGGSGSACVSPSSGCGGPACVSASGCGAAGIAAASASTIASNIATEVASLSLAGGVSSLAPPSCDTTLDTVGTRSGSVRGAALVAAPVPIASRKVCSSAGRAGGVAMEVPASATSAGGLTSAIMRRVRSSRPCNSVSMSVARWRAASTADLIWAMAFAISPSSARRRAIVSGSPRIALSMSSIAASIRSVLTSAAGSVAVCCAKSLLNVGSLDMANPL